MIYKIKCDIIRLELKSRGWFIRKLYTVAKIAIACFLIDRARITGDARGYPDGYHSEAVSDGYYDGFMGKIYPAPSWPEDRK